MKTSCKNIDIADWQTVYPWVLDCLERHRKRYDFRAMLCTTGRMSRADYQKSLDDKSLLIEPAQHIAQEAVRRIQAKELGLRPVRIRTKIDASTQKVRQIGTEDAMQQVFDHIAVNATMDIWKRRTVPQQASSFPGRGQVYGVSMISRWIKKDNRSAAWAKRHGKRYTRQCKYFVKLDIKSCFGSMRKDTFMELFSRDCGNQDLLWLWDALLTSHHVDGYEGFMIGALPSQWAAQYIMGFLYRYAMELHSVRRGKRVRWVSHCLMFMDDILLVGSSRRNIKAAAMSVSEYAQSRFGLTVKPTWCVYCIDTTPVDMMGYLVHADGAVTVRPRVFLRVRRIALRVARVGSVALRQAKRLTSYKGYFRQKRKYRRWLDLKSAYVNKIYNLKNMFHQAAQVVSRAETRKELEYV